METPPNESSNQEPASGDELVDRAGIDALLDGAGSDARTAPSAAPGERPGADTEASQTVSQDDVDALLHAAGDVGTPRADARSPVSQDAVDPPESIAGVDSTGPPSLDGVAVNDKRVSSLEATARSPSTPGDARPLDLPDLECSVPPGVDPKRVTMLNDVDLRVKIQLGQTRMLVEDVLKLGEGSVVELDKLAGDPVDVFVNDRLIARGEVLVLNDNFCVRVSEVLSCDPHRVSA